MMGLSASKMTSHASPSAAPQNLIAIMGRRTEEEDDKWVGVNDSRKRKQIQDRLAQRARRASLP